MLEACPFHPFTSSSRVGALFAPDIQAAVDAGLALRFAGSQQ